jgi:ATP-dependent RNA helicase RhlE
VPAAGRSRRIIINSSFNELGLLAELLRAVEAQGYTQPTPIQQKAIPPVLAGRDLLAAAQTGTGKTAGFVLPLLQRLTESKAKGSPDGRRPPRVLILTPTRELAAQVEESVRAYGAHLPFKSAVIFGGVGIQPQVDALRRGVQILVATPGRLLDHVQQKTVDLSRIEILVLDEADRMLDMGFIRDIRRILALLPKERQSLLFSATFSPEIRELAHSFLTDPEVVEVARRNAASELVRQSVYPVDQGRKRELLAHLITAGAWEQVLVFTRTKHGANRLAQQLERDGIAAQAIHGNKSQSHRTRTLAEFKQGALRVLVATDIAARGLDIEELPHVVNFDLPHVAEDYVHRIGRTGRAGAEGEAVSLMSAEDRPLLADIEKLIGRTIERRVEPAFEPSQSHAEPAPRPAQRQPQRRQSPARGQQAPRGEAGRRGAGGNAGEPRTRTQAGEGAGRSGARSGAGQQQRTAQPAQRQGAGGQPPRGGGGGPRRGGGASRTQATTARGHAAPAKTGERAAPQSPQRDAKPQAKKPGTFASLLAGARRLIG